MVTCGNGHTLPDALGSEPADRRTPCPECGSTLRSHFVDLVADLQAVGVVSGGLGIAVTYVPDRPWQERWRLALDRLEALQEVYAGRGGSRNSVQLGRVSVDFFEACFTIKDGLRSDAAVLAATKAQVERYVWADASLSLAGNIANTSKHLRRDPGKISAWVQRVDISGSAVVSMTVAWTDPVTGEGGTQDALDLATRAVSAWRKFFKAHGLNES